MQIFFQDYAKVLLVLHGLAAVVLIGSSAHMAWRAVRGTLSGKEARVLWVAWSYVVTFVSGMFIYPTYRWYVRALYFEPQMRSVNFYFEIKEHLSALGLALVLACWLVARAGEEPALNRFRRIAAVAIFVTVAYGYVVSLILNNLKGI